MDDSETGTSLRVCSEACQKCQRVDAWWVVIPQTWSQQASTAAQDAGGNAPTTVEELTNLFVKQVLDNTNLQKKRPLRENVSLFPALGDD